VCFALASTILESLNAATFLIEMPVLSAWHFINTELYQVVNGTVFRTDCKDPLESSVCKRTQDLGLCLRRDRHFVIKIPAPVC
jgi:hypothetical protein